MERSHSHKTSAKFLGCSTLPLLVPVLLGVTPLGVHDPKLEEEDESLVGEYTLTVKYGLKNHPFSTGVSFSFNIAIMAS